MSQNLSGKRAVVTGATRGIGRTIAETLLKEGMKVAICGRNEEGVRSAVTELGGEPNVYGRTLDVREERDVTEFFRFVDSSLGGMDVLVNNAGVGIFAPVADLAFEDWKAVIETNLSGVFYCCREAIPRFRHSGGGAIINISSLAGRNPFAGGAAYNASKFGLNGFSEALMLDHRREGIRVTYVMPGSVDTDFSPRSERASWKIAPQDIADIVVSVLRLPERTTVSRVEVRPSIPPK